MKKKRSTKQKESPLAQLLWGKIPKEKRPEMQRALDQAQDALTVALRQRDAALRQLNLLANLGKAIVFADTLNERMKKQMEELTRLVNHIRSGL